ncbi:MAG: AEC family transporter [bacterium]|nr:AEC family transporter [bacterium]
MYLKILIITSIILTGFLLKKAGILSKKDGEVLLNKVLFYVVLPSAIFLNISKLPLSFDLIFLPISVWGIALICLAAAFLYAKLVKMPNRTKGTLFAGTTMMNMQMVAYPLISFVYGAEAFGKLLIFEFGGYLWAFTAVYFLAIYYGKSDNGEGGGIGKSFKKFLKIPPIWALFSGIAVNLLSAPVPDFLKDVLAITSAPMLLLLLISLGIYFEPKINKIRDLAAAISIRIGIGLAAGFLMVTLFHLEGLSRIVVLVTSMMPAGYNTLVFSAKEKLDEEFAASLVAISVIVSLAFIPLLTLFIG